MYIAFAFLLGIGAFYVDSNNFCGQIYNGQECIVYGRISDDIFENDNYCYVTLENVNINQKNEHNINVCIYGSSENIIVGNLMVFSAEIYNHHLFENNKFNYFAYMKNTPYFCYVNFEDTLIVHGEMTLSEKLKDSIKTILQDNMSENGALFGFNTLFGEKSDLNKDLKQDFSISGIAHLLAVSGLQIQFLALALFFLLKKFKVAKLPQFIIIGIILLIYAYLCSFSASVVRSSLMCLVFLSAGLFGRPYDTLNSIAISGLIILIFSPLMVFDVGFQMSFACVLAIAFFWKPISRALQKIKIPRNLSVAIAIDVSTTIAIFPILAIYFGKLSFLTIFANLISVPLFAVGYIILLGLIILVCLFGFLGFLLFIPDVILRLIILVAGFVAEIESSILTLPQLDNVMLMFFYISLFILSCYVLLKFINKTIIISSVAVVCIVISIIFNLPNIPNSNTFTQLNSSDSCAVLRTKNNEVLVVGGTKDTEFVSDYLNMQKIRKVHTLVVMSETDDETSEFVAKYKIDKVILNTTEPIFAGEFKIEFINLNELKKAVLINVNNFTMLFACNVHLGSNQILTLKNNFENTKINMVYSKKDSQGFSELSDYDLRLTTFKNHLEDNIPSYDIFSTGNFTFEFNNGTISNIRRV
ncbi:MAG: ComEC/Rec2 family competence protein [Clostridia bacterium]|nr:ComEC/Rec2 family competence protein [Clostridia bacterium]MDD4685786.1 ComEC/Rec2 family competence protein [Clostridia bacterium]